MGFYNFICNIVKLNEPKFNIFLVQINFSLSEINTIANRVIKQCNSKVILFYGEMGVGKTTLIRAIVNELGFQGEVSSPTFSIVNEYDIKDDLVYHFDFYRLKDEMEAFDIGFEEYVESGHWCLIEWPEKIANLLPENACKILLETDNEQRNIKFNFK